MEFSKEQLLAIQTHGQNVLVSAGAGSGKTAVLTERILHFYKMGYPFKNFLVLTFTQAAAMEMKVRTRGKLLLDPLYKDRAFEIDEAHIETFDAFFLYLVKRYSYHLNIPSNISIIDGTIMDIKKRNILRDIIKEKVQDNDTDFLNYVYDFCSNSFDNVIDVALSLAAKASLKINKEDYLNNFVNNYYSKEKANEYVDRYFEEIKKAFEGIRSDTYRLDNINEANKIIEVLDSIDLTSYDSFYLTAYNKSLPRAKASSELRNDIKRRYNYYLPTEKNKNFGVREDIVNNICANAKNAKVIVNIVKELNRRIDIYKKSTNCYAFDDIANMALSLVKREDVRKELKQQFKLILVDEYQDTSDIQDEIISLIGDNNIFMVGDVKQSIYRFRNANPVIFQNKFKDYKKGLNGVEIDLNNSYRSRRQVVDFINESFDKLMNPNINPIDYKDGHTFGFGQVKYDSLEQGQDFSPEFVCIDNSDKKINDKVIDVMADDIIDRIQNKFQIFDKEKNALRDVTFKDFAIIIQSSTHFDRIKRKFTERNIPLFVNRNVRLYHDDVLYVIKSFATLYSLSYKKDYDNPKYKHAFVSLARSFIYQMKDNDIYKVVRAKDYQSVDFIKNIEDLTRKSNLPSIFDIIYDGVQMLDLYHKLPLIGDYNSNNSKVEFLLNTATSMDKLNLSLDDFINYFETIEKDEKIKVEFSNVDVPQNAVTLITIHTSKGLEFPICYFPYLWTSFNRSETSTSFIVDDYYGLTLTNVRDPLHFTFTNALAKDKIKQEQLSEMIRLYYVALTRAREKIIMYGITGGHSTPESLTSFSKFNQLIGLYDTNNKYYIEKEPIYINFTYEEKKGETKEFIFKSINPVYDEIIAKKASKEIVEEIDENLLAFGRRIHYLLEIVDYEKKDLSFIKDERERRIINRVLNSIYFKDVKNDEIRHEFEFYDELNDVHGIIDCLIIKEDSITIIDFKLKNISDEKYDRQLKIYKDYIKQIAGNKNIKTILLATLDGESRETYE